MPSHPFAVPSDQLVSLLPAGVEGEPVVVTLAIPAVDGIPELSPNAQTLTGNAAPAAAPASKSGRSPVDGDPLDDLEVPVESSDEPVEEALPEFVPPKIGRFDVPALRLAPVQVPTVLEHLADLADRASEGKAVARVGSSVDFYSAVTRTSLALIAEQRFVPVLRQSIEGATTAGWQPWLSDGKAIERVSALVAAMPGEARAAVDRNGHRPWAIVEDCMCRLTDAWARRALISESFYDAVAEKDPAKDQPVAMLRALLAEQQDVPGTPAVRQEMLRRVRQWLSVLEERGASSLWRLLFRVSEPIFKSSTDEDSAPWSLSFHLQSQDVSTLIVDAADVWGLPGDSLTVMGRRIDQPQDLILGELGRASRIYKRLEKALDESEPVDLNLNTKQAYEFLREVAPLLKEQGFGIQSPDWWDSPLTRLGARLRVESDEAPPAFGGPAGGSGARPAQIGLGALVKYRWEIALGETTLTLEEFEHLAKKNSPLVRVNGRWVEIRPEDVQAAIKFMRENQSGEMSVGDALRVAYGTDLRDTGIPIVGLEATGWVSSLMNAEAAHKHLTNVEPPKSFHGTLRPYQLKGLSWLVFLERMGLSMCLADDMGLGKTIQLLALLAMEREAPPDAPPEVVAAAASVKPTLLIVPMSVVGNWMHETKRFCPHLRVLVHHGPERKLGDVFRQAVAESDLIITTYTLAHRDREMFQSIEWGRIVLDEAQYIKNAVAKQSQAVRGIPAQRRVALTGTPVENRLSELWSILDFLNPGYLGTAHGFRTRFSIPIERYRDKSKADQLRGLIRPFILRRLKSDPTVVADLPAKVETREFAPLTSEQAELYETCVRRMLAEVENAEGIQRRGMVLSGLIRLKQICNHPSQLLKDWTPDTGRPPAPGRSGKCIRLLEMMEEIVGEGDCSLIFTQFRQMGTILQSMLSHHLGRNVLFLHGGTPQLQRVKMVESFQRADGKNPVMLVSLKAGGVGLNLTAATHVFHFDRWWNPAVENQATDRAYRIGQTRTVQVHKFVVKGTLEERIDQMIEQKTELADKIIGAGENWLTELDTDQLRDLLTLRNDMILDEA
ncbi:MAG: ATP-dependent helicase [Tepidisphaera sp.]